MQTWKYSEFSRHLHDRVAGVRVPINGVVEPTHRCPLRCVHCYNNLPLNDGEAARSELTADEHKRILDEIAEAGCLWLLYTGGEILARGDFLEIYAHAKRRGLIITLFTNGVLITEAIADFLAQWRPFCIEITLYGRTQETYERITRVPGSYDRCMRGIRMIMDRGLPLKLKTMVLTLNRHEIWEMKRFSEEELGLDFRFDGMINPRIDGSQTPLSFRLSPEQVVALDLMDPKRMDAWRRFGQRFCGPVHPPEEGRKLYHCGGGMTSFAVDPRGKLSPCVLANGESWHLRTGSFGEGWGRFLLGLRERTVSQETKCVACSIKAMCGMCPANAELECGDPERPVDFLCRVAHLRAMAIGLEIPPHGECAYCKGGQRHGELMEKLASILGGPDRKTMSMNG